MVRNEFVVWCNKGPSIYSIQKTAKNGEAVLDGLKHREGVVGRLHSSRHCSKMAGVSVE
jgi:hypothetical protein